MQDITLAELFENVERASARIGTLEKVKAEVEEEISARDTQLENHELAVATELKAIENRIRIARLELETIIFRSKQVIANLHSSAKVEDTDQLELALERLNPSELVTTKQAEALIRAHIAKRSTAARANAASPH